MTSKHTKKKFIKALLGNRISINDLFSLRSTINEKDLSAIVRNIYDLNEEQILRIAALAPLIAKVDAIKNGRRNFAFYSKVRGTFRSFTVNKVVVAEGDSWFNYPILLSDVIDWISMENNIAVYSIASGGDWLLNMLNAKKYVEQLSTLNPDVFIISGGGNDLVGSNRLAAMVDPSGEGREFEENEWAKSLLNESKERFERVGYNMSRFANGLKYISKDFFALLMFFHLQYYFIFKGILKGGKNDSSKSKFPNIKIITQGYDYALPSNRFGFGFKPWRWYRPFARIFLGHGSWLKRPLELRGISDEKIQKDIIFTMIYLFNEMMIHTGAIFNLDQSSEIKVFHIDSRNFVGIDGWTDELHPLPFYFKRIAKTFIDCINGSASSEAVHFVKQTHS